MTASLRPLRAALGAALLSALLPAARAADVDGAALVRDGNVLFRSNLFDEALERYAAARAAGVDSAVLDYDMGVASYRLERYDEAIAMFERARREGRLAALAAYNIGLSHQAAGRRRDAERWFETAAADSTDPALTALARRALERPLRAGRERGDAAEVRRDRGPRAGELRLRVKAGGGQDDNPNRAPSEAYVDPSQPGAPLVTPEAVPSSFTPLDVTAEYVLHNEAGDSDFVLGYDLNGDYYAEYYANDEITQRVRMGADIAFQGRPNRERRLTSDVFLTRHRQRNFDLDDGVDRSIDDRDDLDLSRQFTYDGAGIRTDFSHTLGPWEWGLDVHVERREYERVPIVANWDTELYLFRTSLKYEFSDAMSLRFVAHAYRRAADERPTRDLDGVLISAYDALDYQYRGLEVGIARSVLRRLDLDVSYLVLDRTDLFEGYNDYTQDRVRVRALYRPGRRFSLSAGVTSRVYEYPNAFAYNDPTADLKDLEDVTMDVAAEYTVKPGLSVLVELSTADVTSTDARAAYTRTRSAVSVLWRR